MSITRLYSLTIILTLFVSSACTPSESGGLLDLTIIAPNQSPQSHRLELTGTPNINRIYQGAFPPAEKNSLRIQYQNFPTGSLTLTLTAYDDHNCPVASKTFNVQIETGKKTLAEVLLDRVTGTCRDAGNDTGPYTDGSSSGDLGTLSTKDTATTVFDSRLVNEGLAPDTANPISHDVSSDQNLIPVLPPDTLPIDSKALDVPVCQPNKRDCTTTLDNDCNGVPDNQETAFCECKKGELQRCQEHPGKDGKGICTAGKQECEFSDDKSTSTWSKTCTGSIGPAAAEVCDPEKKDENCDGQANEGCDCVSGTEVECGTCGGKATCVNGELGTCSKLPLPRDCTSDKDNDCNGKPDNEENTYCKCQSGETQECNKHPGDGTGICKAGTQSCVLSSDKKTSTWGPCDGAVAPKTETCDAARLDEDCDGQANEGCECVSNDTSTPCAEAKCDMLTGAFTPAAFCNSQGKCNEKAAVQCAPHKCTITGCAATCSVDSECIGVRCSINKKCEPCGTLNLPCCAGSDCGSNACQQGVCKVPDIQTTLTADANNTGTCLEESRIFATDRIAMADGVRGNISFKLDTIPRDAIVVSATLRIYQEIVTNGISETLILTKLIDNCWTPYQPIQESTATWLPIVSWIERDVAAMVQSSINSRILRIKLDIGDEAGMARIAHVGTTNQPTLTVHFHF